MSAPTDNAATRGIQPPARPSAQPPARTPRREHTRAWRELNAVVAITARDITLSIKSPSFIIMSLAMPLVMLGLIGGNLMQNMAGGLGFDLGEFMIVGMLVNMLFMTTTMGITSLVDDHETDFTQEMLVSPVSRYAIVTGKILGSSFGALIAMLGVLVVGAVMGITLSVWQLLAILALAPLMCLAGGALAMILLGVIKNNKTANLAVMLISFPQMFLSGVIIPITHSEGILMVLSRLMPMTYCVDLVRSVIYAGAPEYNELVIFNPAVSIVVITALTVVCLSLGTFLFARSEKER
jgi:ABC-2 type transport system permease protein